MEVRTLFIPVTNSDQVVEVRSDELPDEVEEILDILKAEVEAVPLPLWVDFAREYLKQGKTEQFLKILEVASSAECLSRYPEHKDNNQEHVSTLYNTLGAYHLAVGRADPEKREESFKTAQSYFSQQGAKRLRGYEKSEGFKVGEVGQGLVQFYKGAFDKASQYFDLVLQLDPTYIPALLGKAAVNFNFGRYQDALKMYRSVLQFHPNCQASVRLGLGLCYQRLGRPLKARQCFERTLSLEPDNVEALIGLAILEMNTPGAEGKVGGLRLLRTAYQHDRTNPMILNQFSEHFFFKGQYEKVESFSSLALKLTDVPSMRAVSCYQMGRVMHAKGNYSGAFRFYEESIKLEAAARTMSDKSSTFLLPYFGRAQLWLYNGQHEQALADIRTILSVTPEAYEPLKMLSSLEASSGRAEEAVKHFRRVLELNPDDADAWLELATLVEKTNTQEALSSYESAQRLLKADTTEEDVLPAALYNNLGVLYQSMRKFEEADNAYDESMKIVCKVEGHEDLISGPLEDKIEKLPVAVTIAFNIARLHEDRQDSRRAEVIYKAIHDKYADYTSCGLRAAIIAAREGHFGKAHDILDTILKDHAGDRDALYLRGVFLAMAQSWDKGLKAFAALKDTAKSEDKATILQMANIWFDTAFTDSKEQRDKEKVHRNLRHALDYYERVLRLDPSNIYAANGVGAVLAQKGYLEYAKDIFTDVHEATAAEISGGLADVWINLAHVFLGLEQYMNAVKMYQNCLRKFFYNHNVKVMLYLARTFYDFDKLPECKNVLQKAAHLQPSNHTLWFDLGLVMQQFAVKNLQVESKRAADVRDALRELSMAVKVFKYCFSLGDRVKSGFDSKKTKVHLKFCQDMLANGKQHLQYAERKEVQELAEKRAQQQNAEALAQQRIEQELRAKKKQEAEREDVERRAREAEEKLHRKLMEWKAQAPQPGGDQNGEDGKPKKGKGGAKKSKKVKNASDEETLRAQRKALEEAGLDDSSDDEDWNEDMEKPAPEDDELPDDAKEGSDNEAEYEEMDDTDEDNGQEDDQDSPGGTKGKTKKTAKSEGRKRLRKQDAEEEIPNRPVDAPAVGTELDDEGAKMDLAPPPKRARALLESDDEE